MNSNSSRARVIDLRKPVSVRSASTINEQKIRRNKVANESMQKRLMQLSDCLAADAERCQADGGPGWLVDNLAYYVGYLLAIATR